MIRTLIAGGLLAVSLYIGSNLVGAAKNIHSAHAARLTVE